MSGSVIDGRTGEVTTGPVDHRKLKALGELAIKAARAVAEETGQLPQRVDGLGQRWTAKVLGLNGKGGIDYPALVQAQALWEAGEPQRAAERALQKAVRESVV